MQVGDAAAWFAAGVAIVAAIIAMSNANSAHTQAQAALKQAEEAEGARKAAEDSAAEARKANDYAGEQLALMRADREDRKRQDQRDLVLELLHTGRDYAGALNGLILFMGVIADYVETTNSDTWKNFERARAAYSKVLLQARYAVEQPEIIAVINDLEAVGAKLTERTGRLVQSKRDARGHAPIKDIVDATAIPDATNHLMNQLEELMNQHFKQSGDKA